MAAVDQADCRNTLLRRVDPAVYAQLAASMKPVDLPQQTSVGAPGEPARFVYFPETGIASVTSEDDRPKLEIGLIGSDGYVGISTLLGDGISPHSTFVQVPGTFIEIPVAVIKPVLDGAPSFRDLLHRYVQAYLAQVAATAIANARNSVEERLARWILMAHDRIPANSIRLTHDYIAMMLGVRRPGVTVALHVLEGEHAIRSLRGEIRVLDRAKLIGFAKSSYGSAEAEYARLIGCELTRGAEGTAGRTAPPRTPVPPGPRPAPDAGKAEAGA